MATVNSSLAVLTTLTIKKDGGTATLALKRREDGTIVFTDALSHKQNSTAKTAGEFATLLFDAIAALDT